MTGERDVRTVFTEDESSGMVHTRMYVDGTLMTAESDNLDDAGAFREITEDQAWAKSRDLRCKRCFPEVWPAL